MPATSYGVLLEECTFLEASDLLILEDVICLDKSLLSGFQWDGSKTEEQCFTSLQSLQCGILENYQLKCQVQTRTNTDASSYRDG